MNMDWNKYQAEALTTAIYPLERELDYTILGLCSEVAEVAELVYLSDVDEYELRSEIGDCFWYVAAVADALHSPLQAFWEERPFEPVMYNLSEVTGYTIMYTGQLAGILKKSIRDDGGKLTAEKRNALFVALSRVLMGLVQLSKLIGSSSHAVTQANLNKLSDRKQRGVLQGSGDHR